jgi:hypothetical protein
MECIVSHSILIAGILKLICLPVEAVKSDFFAAVYGCFKRFDYWTNLSYLF